MKAWLLVLASIACGCSKGGESTSRRSPGKTSSGPADARPSARWIELLGDERERERAVTELEYLCDAESIPALGEAWKRDDRSLRILQVIVTVAKCSRWEPAIPFLAEAVDVIDDTNPRSVDAAATAAEALGASKLPAALQPLINLSQFKMRLESPGQRAVVVAIAALGELGDPAAVPSLANIVRADPLTRPPQLAGAAINALGQLGGPDALPVLLEALYTAPMFFQQTQRALVTLGADQVLPALREILRGEHAATEALIRDRKLDEACDAGSGCAAIAPRDYYAAIVAGAFADPAPLEELLMALDRPVMPAYSVDGNAGPPAAMAVLDALRRIGSPAAAPAVLALALDGKADASVRASAAFTYGLVSIDGADSAGKRTGLDAMCGMVGDLTIDENLALAAAESCSRIADELREAAPLQKAAARFRTSAAKAKAQAADAYLGYARAFDAMVAGVEVAARCKEDVACLIGTFDASADDLAARLVTDGWVVADAERDAGELRSAQIARAALELARLDAADQAAPMIEAVTAAHGDDRVVRQGVMLAVAQIAPRPCAACVTAIEALVAQGSGTTARATLDYEASLVAALLRP